MNAKWFKKFGSFLAYGFVSYAVLAVILCFVFGPRTAAIRRLNTIAEWGEYPAAFAQGKQAYDAKKFRFSNLYYRIVASAFSSDTALSTVGYGCAHSGRTECAIRFYKRALEKAPQRIWYDYALGVLFFSKKDFDRASFHFQKVVETSPRDAVEGAILAPLNRMPPEQRQQFFSMAASFVKTIMQQSQQLLLVIRVNQAEKIPPPQVVLHPWHSVIQPGKEMFF